MFALIKKITFYSTIIAVPTIILAVVVKYFYFNKKGEETNLEGAVAECVNFIKKVLKLVNP